MYESFLMLPHFRLFALAIGMIVPRHVQRAMDDEARQLFADADAILARGIARNLRRDVDVAHQRWWLPRLPIPKRDHVGVAVALQVTRVEGANGALAHERYGDEGVLHALSAEDALGDLAYALTTEGNANAF